MLNFGDANPRMAQCDPSLRCAHHATGYAELGLEGPPSLAPGREEEPGPPHQSAERWVGIGSGDRAPSDMSVCRSRLRPAIFIRAGSALASWGGPDLHRP